ncbi:MAG: hypothetical protein K0Q72_4142, partial [Armatimonadetes bacterium]|nr:hypothetical protein [Armatimonadota bacterium]
TLEPYLAVIVAQDGAVVYSQQCAGLACLEREVAGCYVPLGGFRYQASEGRFDAAELRAAFHRGTSCCGDRPPHGEQLERLRTAIAAIAYWQSDGAGEIRTHLTLDEDRLSEIVEAWVPVLTPDGPGILTWPNCD